MILVNLASSKLARISMIAILITILASCSSVPLSAMYKMASMDKDDIRTINPREILTRITVDEPTELQTRNVKLVLKFEYTGSEASEYQFLLEFLSNNTFQERQGWFGPLINKSQYEFKLAERSVSVFKKYQREFIKYGKPNKYYWTVYYYLEKRPPKTQKAHLDLELKMASEDDYFYLLKDAELTVE
ncbi:hypothetical protein FLL45_03100 [Aliikangiella marina]|uniref:Uncharacterized protein n=1 Tax=Aliikangiella marina TaxID=1712262 RepID=A0A545TIC6_9GAMM|nr:hypothetical protein [Aliikangiella marina]TQV76953.1 hypothetical protein FLL45_03100 [Aliikangiella marina]